MAINITRNAESMNVDIKSSDFSKICRICLKVKECMACIKKTTVPTLLMEFTSVKVEDDDGLPDLICSECENEVNKTYQFKQKCENADVYLRQILTEKIVSKTENIKIEATDIDFVYSNDYVSDNIETLLFMENEQDKEENYQPKKNKSVKGKGKRKINKKDIRDVKGEIYSCTICNKEYVRHSDYKKHMRRHSGPKRYCCDHCPEQFDQVNALAVHVSKSHEFVSQLFCDICNKEFWVKQQLNRHMKTHASNVETPFTCTICNRSFNFPYILKNHMRAHTGERNYQCKMCDKAFKYPSNLSKHVDYVHYKKRPVQPPPQNKQPKKKDKVMCNLCGTSVVHLKQHFLHKHSDIRAFKCEECGMEFVRKAGLQLHVRKYHKGEDLYTDLCSFCGKRCLSVTALRVHIRTHTNERPCKCTVCGKGFSQPGHLRIHMRLHTGERPYKCMICAKAFVTSSMLKDHNRVHTGEKPFVCTVCERAFSQRKTLKSHMMNCH